MARLSAVCQQLKDLCPDAGTEADRDWFECMHKDPAFDLYSMGLSAAGMSSPIRMLVDRYADAADDGHSSAIDTVMDVGNGSQRSEGSIGVWVEIDRNLDQMDVDGITTGISHGVVNKNAQAKGSTDFDDETHEDVVGPSANTVTCPMDVEADVEANAMLSADEDSTTTIIGGSPVLSARPSSRSSHHPANTSALRTLGSARNPIDLTAGKPMCIDGKIIEVIDLTKDSVRVP
jgi:hypothetical protein